jgi:deazaflavin-dependent oxidoreductase (nitroreductase family)
VDAEAGQGTGAGLVAFSFQTALLDVPVRPGYLPPMDVKPYTAAQERLGSVVIRLMSSANVWLYRLTGGWVGGRFLGGAPVLLLTTLGRRSGEPRTAPLLYLEDRRDLVVVASKGGMSQHPLWYRNLGVTPGRGRAGRERRMTATPPTGTSGPASGRGSSPCTRTTTYQARTTREIPVVILSPRTG